MNKLMLLVIGENRYQNAEHLKLVSKGGKHGLICTNTNDSILSIEYDNIIYKLDSLFWLYQNGKIGLCRITMTADERYYLDMITPCEYDEFENYDYSCKLHGKITGSSTIILRNEQGQRYYNILTNTLSKYYHVIHAFPRYSTAFARNGKREKYYIIDGMFDKVVFESVEYDIDNPHPDESYLADNIGGRFIEFTEKRDLSHQRYIESLLIEEGRA